MFLTALFHLSLQATPWLAKSHLDHVWELMLCTKQLGFLRPILHALEPAHFQPNFTMKPEIFYELKEMKLEQSQAATADVAGLTLFWCDRPFSFAQLKK